MILELVDWLLVQYPVSDGAVLDSDGIHQTGLRHGKISAHMKVPQFSLESGQWECQPALMSDWAGMEVVGHDVADRDCVFCVFSPEVL